MRTSGIQRWKPVVASVLSTILLAGCHAAPQVADRSTVSARLGDRVGQSIPETTTASQVAVPPGASLSDGVTEDEAIAFALWNNAAFQELLADLGVAHGDLVQAGLLPNPEFVYYWPMSDKPYKYLFDFPLEALWLRPIRVRAAAGEAERVAERLTQSGLDLMRDVRQAYSDVAMAAERVRVAGEAVKFRGRVGELAQKRLKAGEISEQEAATARIDALQAKQDATRIGYEVPVAEERLRNLMGLGASRERLVLDPSPLPACREFDVEELAAEATASRPDALASASAAAAAEERLRIAKLGWVRVLGIADATSGKQSHVLGPAARITLPIFNWNQGAVARAEAERDRALLNKQTVANQIVLDVHRAHLQYRQACAELDVLRTKVRPEVEGVVNRAQSAYEAGNVAIFIVLESTRQLLDAYLREAQLQGDLRRAWAELERSVGRRLDPPAVEPEAKPDPAPAPRAARFAEDRGEAVEQARSR